MPRGTNAPNDWPAEPVSVRSMVSSGRPAPPYLLVTSWPRIVPTVRLTLRTASAARTGSPRSRASPASATSSLSSACSSPWSCALVQRGSWSGKTSRYAGWCRIGVRSRPAAFQWSTAGATSSTSDRPMASSRVRKPSCGEQLADLLGDVLEEVDDELRLAGEPLPEHGVLRRHAHRAGVEVADPHHDAAADDQRRRGEAVLLGAQQRRDHHVAAGLELAVGLHDDPVAQAVEQQGLLGLGEAELPGAARVLERGQRRRAGAAVVAGDQHHVGVRLGDARRDRADADLGHQLDVHPGPRVGVLEVVDELLEVLDRVDVVVRRRADQPHARRRVPRPRDPRVDLVARELAALAGLGALGHLDLDVVGVGEVLRRHAEPPGRHLLDRAAALGVVQAVGVLAALAGVGLGAEPVHRDGQRLVRLLADRAVGHRPGREPLDDGLDRLDLVDVDRRAPVLAVLEPEQPAQRHQPLGLLVDALGVLLEHVVAPGAGRVLEAEHGLGVEQVRLALAAPLVLAADRRARGGRARCRRAGTPSACRRATSCGDHVEADAAELGGGAGEVAVDDVGREADRLEDLRAGVGARPWRRPSSTSP